MNESQATNMGTELQISEKYTRNDSENPWWIETFIK
jgi:hypothetical protein